MNPTFSLQYVEAANQDLAVAEFAPENVSPDTWIIHCPAFAEEMNKSRRMVSMQARRFATLGFGVIVPDLSGTGDSQGALSEARWSQWRKELEELQAHLVARGAEHVIFWGLRLGCLMALDVASRQPVPTNLLLWQPVLSGKTYMSQFLRLEVAAAAARSERKVSVAELRQTISENGVLEMAGYPLSAELLTDIDSLKADQFQLPNKTALLCVECGQGAPTPVLLRQQESWEHSKVKISLESIKAPPFWTTQEIAVVPDVFEASDAWLVEESVPGRLSRAAAALDVESATASAITFEVHDCVLPAIIERGERDRGILIIVGGPQYRAGSHRQFTLLAREFASQGFPVMRFDYRGMGDGDGNEVGFLGCEADIDGAIAAFTEHCPHLKSIVLWGLCDAATASAKYACKDERIVGQVLVNPWVRTEAGEAEAYVKHYYFKRIVSREFWVKLLRGNVGVVEALLGFWQRLNRMTIKTSAEDDSETSLIDQMANGLVGFSGNTLILISGDDLTAAEFQAAVRSSKRLNQAFSNKRIAWRKHERADHTFSRQEWRQQYANWTLEWILSLET
jgi:exosortase A-associated hydrolase 1/exosortase A-associated hydrolase 2